MTKKLTDITTKQTFRYPGDLADYLYDEFDFHTVVERDADNEKEAFTRLSDNWDVFCYASKKVADELIQAVNDGVFPGFVVVNTLPSAVATGAIVVKVWLVQEKRGGK